MTKPRTCFAVAMLFVVLSFLLIYSAPPASGDEGAPSAASASESYWEKASLKLGRGLENLLVGWMELFHEPVKTYRDKGLAQASTVGVGRGIILALKRIGVGAYEVVTSPYPQEPLIESMDSWTW